MDIAERDRQLEVKQCQIDQLESDCEECERAYDQTKEVLKEKEEELIDKDKKLK